MNSSGHTYQFPICTWPTNCLEDKMVRNMKGLLLICASGIFNIPSLVSGSRVEIVNKVVDDSPKGIKIVAEIHNEEVREAKIHKINDKDDKYQRSIESLYRNHPFTKESAVRLKMIGERKPVRMTKKERDITLDLHNELRMKEATEMGISDMPYLQWDNNLAEMAQALADTCVFEHYNIHRKGGVLIGQNLGYVVPNELQPMSHFRNVIQAFFDEKVDMNPVTFRCKRGTVCGHYRQMIYSQVKRIGCAFTTCSAIWHVYMKTRNPEFVHNPYTPSYPIFYGVCNYDQYADHNLALFHYGPPCSFCSADKKLPLNCVDSKRSPSLRASLCDQCDVDRTGCAPINRSCSHIRYPKGRWLLCRMIAFRPHLCKTSGAVRNRCADKCQRKLCQKGKCQLGMEHLYPYNIDTRGCKG